MKRIVAALAIAALAGCSLVSRATPVSGPRELAGDWRGRLALRLANAAATLTVKEDGAYAGTMHLEGGDRPFSGAIMLARPGRLRYHGTNGDGTVLVLQRDGETTLRFVPDGGGGGGSFTRVP